MVTVVLKATIRLYAAGQKQFPGKPLVQGRGKSTSSSSTFKKLTLPIGIGVYICYNQYRKVREREEKKLGIHRTKEWSQTLVRVYCSLPLRSMSRVFGKVSEIHLPVFLRKPIFGLYSLAFGCNMEEAIVSDYEYYQSLADFFRRRLKRGVRPVAENSLVCPSDGILHRCGEVDKGVIEQVKGITYTLHEFLGPSHSVQKDLKKHTESVSNEKADKKLYYCVFYLAPGDYHGFHSPTDWTIKHRRHYAGHLLSVGKPILDRIPKLFVLNERVLLEGSWKFGYFSMTAVGATNVGNIFIENDNPKTNVKRAEYGSINERTYIWPRQKGEKVGEFRMGSSVVLIFEAPSNFGFFLKNGTVVKYGQTLGDVLEDPCQKGG